MQNLLKVDMRVCFPTFEIAPFTGGGIGTWLATTLDQYADEGEYEVLYYGKQPISEAEFSLVYPNVKLHCIDTEDASEVLDENQLRKEDGFESYHVWISYVLMRKLEVLEREFGSYDVVEFIDWGGPAFFSLQQKLLGRSLQNTAITVRLHGCDEILRQFENRPWGFENLIVADLEQQSLFLADKCVSHLLPNAQFYSNHYKFDSTWLSRCIIELPPVRKGKDAQTTISPTKETSLCFTSKFQGFKRPYSFLQGAAEFLMATSTYEGNIVFAAFVSDPLERKRIENAIPSGIRDRIHFISNNNRELREDLVSQSIAVFSGVYETFCYAAYEASMAGALVILNGHNPGFGPQTPWIHGVNCLKYDGTSAGLLDALRVAFNTSTEQKRINLQPIDYQHETRPYWSNNKIAPVLNAKERVVSTPLSIIIPVHYESAELFQIIARLRKSHSPETEIVVVDGSGTQSVAAHVWDKIDSEGVSNSNQASVKVVRRSQAANFAVLVNDGVDAASHPIVAILPLDQYHAEDFIKSAAFAINSKDADVVLPTLRTLRHSKDGDPSVSGGWISYGGALRVNTFVNRFGFGCLVARRADLKRVRFDESLTNEWSWDVLLRLTYSGKKIVVDTDYPINIFVDKLAHWAPQSEDERRSTLEAVRRNTWQSDRQYDLPWTSLGDGEFISSDWFINRDTLSSHRHLQVAYEALSNARTVRFALKFANRIKRVLRLS